MKRLEFKSKSSLEKEAKRKLEKDLENASSRTQADAKAWISLRRQINNS